MKPKYFISLGGIITWLVTLYNYTNRNSFKTDPNFVKYAAQNPDVYAGITDKIQSGILYGVVATAIIGLLFIILGLFADHLSKKTIMILSGIGIVTLFVTAGLGLSLISVICVVYGITRLNRTKNQYVTLA